MPTKITIPKEQQIFTVKEMQQQTLYVENDSSCATVFMKIPAWTEEKKSHEIVIWIENGRMAYNDSDDRQYILAPAGIEVLFKQDSCILP